MDIFQPGVTVYISVTNFCCITPEPGSSGAAPGNQNISPGKNLEDHATVDIDGFVERVLSVFPASVVGHLFH